MFTHIVFQEHCHGINLSNNKQTLENRTKGELLIVPDEDASNVLANFMANEQQYAVEILHMYTAEPDYTNTTLVTVFHNFIREAFGDILVFLMRQEPIGRLLQKQAPHLFENIPKLYAIIIAENCLGINGGPAKMMVELISTSYDAFTDITSRENRLVVSHPKLTIVQKESSEIELDFANLSSEVVSQLVGWFDEIANEIDPSRRPIGTFDNEDP